MPEDIINIKNSRILVVDDVPANLDILRKTLEEESFEISVAMDGDRALSITPRLNPHLILLDIMMPKMSGFETCVQLKSFAETKHIPVIFLSAKDQLEDIVKGFEVGGVDYVTKPFQHREVVMRVKTHLQLYHENRIRQMAEAELQKHVETLRITQFEILERLGQAAAFKDNDTGSHIKRMSEFSVALGRAVGMSDDECEILRYASTMHDIGKIGIPDRVLLKPGKLDSEEWQIMKTHTTIGQELLSGSKSRLLQMAATIALVHQEKWDGTGYPHGLKGKDIPLVGRIVSICDVFDALTMTRPYKKSWSDDDALRYIIEQKDKHFDPELVRVFRDIYPEIINIKNSLNN